MIEFLRDNFSVLFLSTVGGVAGFCYSRNYYPIRKFQSLDLATVLYTKILGTLDVVKPFVHDAIQLGSEESTVVDVGLLRGGIFEIIEKLTFLFKQRFKATILEITRTLERNQIPITLSLTGFMVVYCSLKKFIQNTNSKTIRSNSRSLDNLDPLSLLIRYLEYLVTETSKIMYSQENVSALFLFTIFVMFIRVNPDFTQELLKEQRFVMY